MLSGLPAVPHPTPDLAPTDAPSGAPSWASACCPACLCVTPVKTKTHPAVSNRPLRPGELDGKLRAPAAGANAMTQSLAQGRRVALSKVDSFADGVAVKFVGAETFRLCRELLDGCVLVDNTAISSAIKVGWGGWMGGWGPTPPSPLRSRWGGDGVALMCWGPLLLRGQHLPALPPATAMLPYSCCCSLPTHPRVSSLLFFLPSFCCIPPSLLLFPCLITPPHHPLGLWRGGFHPGATGACPLPLPHTGYV